MTNTPFSRFAHFVWIERIELFILACYALASGLLALAVPLAAQALVNTIVQGLFLQPLIVLTTIVFFGLLFSGFLKTLQMALAERMQQRMFARLGLRLSELLPRFQRQAFVAKNGPVELNKFFEIVNIQKSWNKLLLDVPAGLVEFAISFAFLALYGPSLVSVCAITVLVSLCSLLLLGYGGLSTSISESNAKYKLAGWLEQVGRCQDSIKVLGEEPHFVKHSDGLVGSYLKYRKSHFSVLLRQIGFFYILNAVCSAGILGLGGWMVIERQISVGQLVAAELVVLNLLKSAEKMVKATEPFYDLLTGLEKIAALLEIPTDEVHTLQLPEETPKESPVRSGLPISIQPLGCRLQMRNVSLRYAEGTPLLLDGLDLTVQPGERISILGPEGCGKSTLGQIAVGILQPSQGWVDVQGLSAHRIDHKYLARLSDAEELLDGDVELNLTLGRQVSSHDLRWALELSGLLSHLGQLPKGLQSPIRCGGQNLSSSQRLRVLLARTLLSRPHLLVVDHTLTSLDPQSRTQVARALCESGQRWTLINLVAELELLLQSDTIYWMEGGKVQALGAPRIAGTKEPLLKAFPNLAQQLSQHFTSDGGSV